MNKIEAEELFQLEGTYTLKDVKRRYSKLVLQFHPDTVRSSAMKQDYTNRMYAINDANEFLRSQFVYASSVVSDWTAPTASLIVSPGVGVSAVESEVPVEETIFVSSVEDTNTIHRACNFSFRPVLAVLSHIPFCAILVFAVFIASLSVLCDGNFSAFLDSTTYGVLFSPSHTLFTFMACVMVILIVPALLFDPVRSWLRFRVRSGI